MIFNGYTTDTLVPVIIGLAVIIGILYIIRVRRRTISVPYIGLWKSVLEKKSHRRWHDWIKRIISFLICMIVVGLLSLALLDPREEEDNTARRHAIIVLDTSASMAASSGRTDCETRFECAQKDAHELIDHIQATDRAIIIEASGIVSAVSGPFQSDKSSLHKTLNSMSVRATSVDMKKALELASHLSNERANPEIYLLTDGQFDNADELSKLLPGSAAFEQKTYGKPEGNLSIEAFNVRRYIANRLGFEVFFKAHNGFENAVTAKLVIHALGDDEIVYNPERAHETIVEKTLTLASGDSELRLYDNLTVSSSRMAATLEIESPTTLVDPLPADNIAYARIPDFAKPDIACITPGNLYLEAALLLNENYRVSFIKPTDTEILTTSGEINLSQVAGSHDIVILDNSYRNLPHITGEDWNGRVIFINPDEDDSPFKTKAVSNPVIERVNSKHAVARWLSLKNLNISKANVFSGIKNEDLIMRAIEGPLMATKKSSTQRILAIGFSLVESDLIFRVGLPVLFINAVDWMMDENGEPLRGYPTGNAWHIALKGDAQRVDIVRPNQTPLSNVPVYESSATLYGEMAGFYQVSDSETHRPLVEFASNFYNPVESELSRAASEVHGRIHLKTTLMDEKEEDEESSWLMRLLSKLPDSSQYIWVLALLIAMGLITVEWLTYHRRWTV